MMPDVAKKSPKSRIGGPRPGAGRKPTLKKPMLRSVSFEKAQVVALKRIANRRGWTFAEAVRQAVAAYLKRAAARLSSDAGTIEDA